jgi:hypothetical protein
MLGASTRTPTPVASPRSRPCSSAGRTPADSWKLVASAHRWASWLKKGASALPTTRSYEAFSSKITTTCE